MCRDKDEGGQRCASHTRDQVTAKAGKYALTGKEEDLQALIASYTEYASTDEGHELALENLTVGRPGPGDLPTEMWQRIADHGAMLRERNATIAAEIRAARAPGDAFHKDVVAKMETHREVPPSVRGTKSLNAWLNDVEQDTAEMARCYAGANAERVALADLKREIETAPVNPKAAATDRVPRSEEERQDWLQHLALSEQRRAADADMYLHDVQMGNIDLATFERSEVDPHGPRPWEWRARIEEETAAAAYREEQLRDPSLTEGAGEYLSRDMVSRRQERERIGWTIARNADPATVGFVARVRKDDGTLSDQTYIVSQTQPRAGAPRSATGVTLIDATATDTPANVYGVKREGIYIENDTPPMYTTVDKLVPATADMQVRYGGYTNVTPYTANPHVAAAHPRVDGYSLTTPAQAVRSSFDNWRINRAVEGNTPYRTSAEQARFDGSVFRRLFGNG